MEIIFLIKGLILGFSIAAPVGPIGLLCISRTLEKGRIAGFVTGLGAATADGIYGLIAGFGLTVITTWLTSIDTWIKLIGGIFLLYLGFKTFTSKTTKRAKMKDSNLLGNYISTVFLTLTNPTTILSFMAIFAGFGVTSTSISSSSLLVLGVFFGSALWWLILSFITNLLRMRLEKRHLEYINKGSGMLILGFGITSLVSIML